MRLHGNQALTQFVATAAATTPLWMNFASARIGEGLRQAPVRNGFDPTAPAPVLRRSPDATGKQRRRSSPGILNAAEEYEYFDRPSSSSIEDSLNIRSHPIIAGADMEDVDMHHPYEGTFKNTQNATIKNTTSSSSRGNKISRAENDDPTDLGVLATPVQTPSAVANDVVREPASANDPPTVCMIGYYG